MSAPRAKKAKTSKPLPPPGAPNKHAKANCPFRIGIGQPEYQLPAKPSLKDLVDGYINGGFQAHLERVLDIFRQCGFDTAVRCAGLAQCPVCARTYPHQTQVYLSARTAFSKALLQVKAQLKAARDFEALFKAVRDIADDTAGIGPLTAYDASLRIAANLGILPAKIVYGWQGAVIHERKPISHSVPFTDFRPEITARLTAYQIEDFLCVWHKQRYDKEKHHTLISVLK
jgi:hypothetical protein